MERLIGYLNFIKEKHLEEAARESLRVSREMDFPLMRMFAHVPDEVLLPQSMKSLADFAENLRDGTYLEKQSESMQKWENDQLEGISKDDIQPTDLVLIYAAQKKAMHRFIPLYTQAPEEIIDIINELEEVHVNSQNAAINMMFKWRKETEDRLTETNTFLDAVLENIPNMVFVKDATDLRFMRFNKAGEKLLGYPRENLIGKNDFDFFSKEQATFFIDKDRDVLSKGMLVDIPEEPIDTADKGVRWLHTKKIPVKDSEGDPMFLLGISEDITERKAVTQALKESEERFRLLVNNAKDYAIFMIDPEGYIISWNQGAERIKGYTAEEIIGKHISVFYTPQDTETREFEKNLGRAKKLGRYEIEGWRLRKNGERFWADVIFTALYDDEGKLKGFSKITRDISERKQAEDELKSSREKFLKIFNLSPVPTYITEVATGKFLYVNDAFENLFSLSREQIIGKTAVELNILTPDRREAAARTIKEQGGKVRNMELRMQTLSGESKDMYVSSDQIEMDNMSCYLATMVDITERIRSEEKISRLNRDLNESIVQLDTVNKELEAFTYSVSHDLRAPLRAINGYANIFEEDYVTKMDDEGKRLLNVIRYNAEKMGRLIDDLLAFSRLGRKELDKSEENMQQLVEGVLIELNKTSEYHAEIKTGKLYNASVDYGLMHQAILNLVSNAVKYSSKTEKPVVEIGSEKTDQEVIFHVKDNGVGFDMKYKDKLFGVFQRLHGMDEFEGTGVGLAIVQRIVTKHKGRVWAEAEVNKGATFYIALPN